MDTPLCYVMRAIDIFLSAIPNIYCFPIVSYHTVFMTKEPIHPSQTPHAKNTYADGVLFCNVHNPQGYLVLCYLAFTYNLAEIILLHQFIPFDLCVPLSKGKIQ